MTRSRNIRLWGEVTLTPTMVAAMERMRQGATLRGSSIGKGELIERSTRCDIVVDVHPRTFAALIRHALILRNIQVRDTLVWQWKLTGRGLQALGALRALKRKAEKEARG